MVVVVEDGDGASVDLLEKEAEELGHKVHAAHRDNQGGGHNRP